jgi:GNAT superfamily N-acetyltransferase
LPRDEEIRPEPADGRAAKRLLAAFEAEVVRIYPFWSAAIGPTAHPEEFLAPYGGFFVVYLRGTAVGCGGFKRLDRRTAEIKRMFVLPEARNRGIARRILEHLEREATKAGYGLVRLDTGDRQPEALHLYRSAGYEEIPDYNGNPAASYWFEKSVP